MADEHPGDSPGRDTELCTDPGWPSPFAAAYFDDPLLGLRRRPDRGAARPRGPVDQAPASPRLAKRSSHVVTHLRETPIAAATWVLGQPAWCRRTISNRPWKWCGH